MTPPRRNCDYCGTDFQPVRVDQRFHTKECKRAWFVEYDMSHPHVCRQCHLLHDPDARVFLDVVELWAKSEQLDDAGRREGTRATAGELLVELLRMVDRHRGELYSAALRRRASGRVVTDDADVAQHDAGA